MDKWRSINNGSRDRRAAEERRRTRRRAEPSAAAPPPPLHPQDSASPAITIDSDHPPPLPFHYPSSPTVNAKTASSPAIVTQGHPPPPDSPPPLPPVPCHPAPPPPLSSLLNPQVSASPTTEVRTAPPAIFMDLNDPNESAPWYTLVIFEALSILNSPTGSSINDIANSIKERHGVPGNLRELLRSKLEDLVWMGKLELGRHWGTRNFRQSLGSKLEDVKLEVDQKWWYKIKKVESPTPSEHRSFLAAKAFEEARKFETIRKGWLRRDG